MSVNPIQEKTQVWKAAKEHSRGCLPPAVRLPPGVFHSIDQVNFSRTQSTFIDGKSTKSVQSQLSQERGQPFQENKSTSAGSKVNGFRTEMELLIFRVRIESTFFRKRQDIQEKTRSFKSFSSFSFFNLIENTIEQFYYYIYNNKEFLLCI